MKIKKIFEIELDEPAPHWLCADNLATALNDYCKGANANFVVKELGRYPDYPDEKVTREYRWSKMNSGDKKVKDFVTSYNAPRCMCDKTCCWFENGKLVYRDCAKHYEESFLSPPESKPTYHGTLDGLNSSIPDPSEYTVVKFADVDKSLDKLKAQREFAKEHNERTYPSIKDKDRDSLPPGVQKCSKCGIIMSANSLTCFNCGAVNIEMHVYGDSLESIYEQNIASAKKRCEELGIEMPKPIPLSELSNMPMGVRVCPKCNAWTCAFDPNPCKVCGYTAGTAEDKKRARFYKELSALPATMGAGMCAGCGKVRGSMAIYGGVACEECGYKPERLTQESIDGGFKK